MSNLETVRMTLQSAYDAAYRAHNGTVIYLYWKGRLEAIRVINDRIIRTSV